MTRLSTQEQELQQPARMTVGGCCTLPAEPPPGVAQGDLACLDLPLTLPRDEAPRRDHLTRLRRGLAEHRGVRHVQLCAPSPAPAPTTTPTININGRPTASARPAPACPRGVACPIVRVHYDRRAMRPAELWRRLDRLAIHGSPVVPLAARLPVTGLDEPDPRAAAQAALDRLPGVVAQVTPEGRHIDIEHDPSRTPLSRIVRDLERVGADLAVASPPVRTGWRWAGAAVKLAVEYPQLGTAVVGGLLLAVGAAVYLADGPTPLRLTLLAAAYGLCGWAIAWETVQTLLQRKLDIDLLMFAAAVGAAILGHFEEGALLLLLFSLGESGEQLAVGRARRAIHALSRIAPRTATRIEADAERTVPVEELSVGDRVRVAADEQIPADGEVVEGESAVDQSAITGESVPVDKAEADAVFAGTMNGPGSLIIAVTRRAEDNTLSKVIRMVEQAQAARSPTQQLTERFTRWYVPVVLATTLVLMVAPPLVGIAPRRTPEELWGGWFYQALAFLTAASPCALAIGTPAAILTAIGRAARIGVLVKGGVHIENLGQVRAVAFDKTGTITRGRPRVTELTSLDASLSGEDLLRLAASVERGSGHPLARAVVEEATRRALTLDDADETERHAGLGITGRVGGRAVTVGSTRMMSPLIDDAAAKHIETMRAAGHTVLCVAVDDALVGLIGVADELRPTAAATMQQLKALGITRTVMLTGDHPAAADAIARQVGITDVHAELMPDQKLERIRELDTLPGGVVMVGDGVNDAPALAAARVGVAIGGAGSGGSDVALETADIALMADDLAKLPQAIALARAARRIIRQNLVIALGVIMLLAPAGALGFAPISVAVLFHEGSTIVVILNGLRLLRTRV
ncbi:MAG: heavy metal translocating P-type ATPase [Phycisphaeraceae bacterium]